MVKTMTPEVIPGAFYCPEAGLLIYHPRTRNGRLGTARLVKLKHTM